MFLDQKKDVCAGDFIYMHGHKQALLYTGGGGVDSRSVVKGAQLPRVFAQQPPRQPNLGRYSPRGLVGQLVPEWSPTSRRCPGQNKKSARIILSDWILDDTAHGCSEAC
jgi:hypothetical protein